jgi:hypothetical protein
MASQNTRTQPPNYNQRNTHNLCCNNLNGTWPVWQLRNNTALHSTYCDGMWSLSFHILIFCHTENNNDPPNCDDPDGVWKMRRFLAVWKTSFVKCINPTGYIAIDEVVCSTKEEWFFGSIFQRNAEDLFSEFTNSVTLFAEYMTWVYTLPLFGEFYYLADSFCYIEQKIYLRFGRLQFQDTTPPSTHTQSLADARCLACEVHT